ncbi:MAG: hypothetical protein J6J12_10630 [Oscillospiraceae bacterium]|nr:hypothetical protein [Oscillospiraceae bacterium]
MKIEHHTALFQKICKRIPELIFFLAAAASILTTWYATGQFLDSDASSELVLAQHWVQTGNILSKDWIYGSEFRLLHMQLLYAPLMLVFEDWHMIRFLGAVLAQAIYMAAYVFLLHQAGLDRRFFYLGGAILLLPVSVAYGRVVLYHNHYLPNIIISFFLVGLLLGFSQQKNWKKAGTWLRLATMLALSYLSGIHGVRQLMITHGPLVLILVAFSLIDDSRSTEPHKTAFLKPERLHLLLCAVANTVAALLGLITNHHLINQGYCLAVNPAGFWLGIQSGSTTGDILHGYFHQFGFRENVPMVSLIGILSFGGLLLGIFLVVISVKRLLCTRDHKDIRQEILFQFFLFYTGIMLLLFVITSGGYCYTLYLSLCLPWAVPLLLDQFFHRPAEYHILHPRKLFAWLTVLLLFANGVANLTWFNGSKLFDQPYEGLLYQDTDKKEDLSEVLTYILENGYDAGYAPHWECNIVIEMTNGQLPVATVLNMGGNLSYGNCLTSLWFRDVPTQKPFLLLEKAAQASFERDPSSSQYCTLVYDDGRNCLYDILDLEMFIPTLYS